MCLSSNGCGRPLKVQSYYTACLLTRCRRHSKLSSSSTAWARYARDGSRISTAQAKLSAANEEAGKIRHSGDDVTKGSNAPGDELAIVIERESASDESRNTWLSPLTISPFFFWGTSMVAMKALSPHTAPLFVSAVRMLPAGLAVLAWGKWEGRPQPVGYKAWLWIAAFGFADATCFQGFLAEGLQRTSAGLGSIIIDSQPLSVAVLASLLFGEKLSFMRCIGLGVGVLGLCFLELTPEAIGAFYQGLQSVDRQQPEVWNIWSSGEWWMLLAAQSMAVGTVLVRYVSKYADPIMATGYHMLLGGVPLLLLSLQQESTMLAERLPLLSGSDYLLLAYISLLGSAASYGVFFLSASRGNLTALSSLTFLTPCFAAATGFLAFGETLSLQQLIGATVTLGGVFLINKEQ